MLVALPENPRNLSDSTLPTGLHRLLSASAFAMIHNVGFIRVTGEDRVRWLNGMVTNSVVALRPGQGCYCFFLSAQGRIQGHATAWLLEDSILLQTALDRVSPLIALLDRFIIMDDVELRPVDGMSGLLLAGPESASVLARLGLASEHSVELTVFQASFEGAPARIFTAHSPIVPRFELWAAPEIVERMTDVLRTHLPEASSDDLERLRVLEGTPSYGIDIRDRELPQETSQKRALHFSKGCYLGQEIVERIQSRGNVHRTFTGFRLHGHVPPAGVPLFAEDAPDNAIGELTSVAAVTLPHGESVFALGYIRREALERHASLRYAGGSAEAAALPFTITPTSEGDNPLPYQTVEHCS